MRPCLCPPPPSPVLSVQNPRDFGPNAAESGHSGLGLGLAGGGGRGGRGGSRLPAEGFRIALNSTRCKATKPRCGHRLSGHGRDPTTRGGARSRLPLGGPSACSGDASVLAREREHRVTSRACAGRRVGVLGRWPRSREKTRASGHRPSVRRARGRRARGWPRAREKARASRHLASAGEGARRACSGGGLLLALSREHARRGRACARTHAGPRQPSDRLPPAARALPRPPSPRDRQPQRLRQQRPVRHEQLVGHRVDLVERQVRRRQRIEGDRVIDVREVSGQGRLHG